VKSAGWIRSRGPTDGSIGFASFGPGPLLRRHGHHRYPSSILRPSVAQPCGFARSLRPLLKGILSWGFQFAPPSASALRVHSRPPDLANETWRLRFGAAVSRTRSVLAVPPGFDGFLRASPCRFVAPCNRPWGSLRFRRSAVTLPGPPFSFRSRWAACGATLVTSPGRLCRALETRCVRLAWCRHPARLLPRVPALPARPPRLLARSKTGASKRGARGLAGIVPAVCHPRSASPFGAFPSPVAVPRHRGRCPLAVRSLRLPARRVAAPSWPSLGTFDLKAFLHRRVRCVQARCRA